MSVVVTQMVVVVVRLGTKHVDIPVVVPEIVVDMDVGMQV